MLAMVARVYHGVDGTCCQTERNFSSLALTADSLRGVLSPRKIEQLVFLRLNAHFIREVAAYQAGTSGIEERYQAGRAKACV